MNMRLIRTAVIVLCTYGLIAPGSTSSLDSSGSLVNSSDSSVDYNYDREFSKPDNIHAPGAPGAQLTQDSLHSQTGQRNAIFSHQQDHALHYQRQQDQAFARQQQDQAFARQQQGHIVNESNVRELLPLEIEMPNSNNQDTNQSNSCENCISNCSAVLSPVYLCVICAVTCCNPLNWM